MDERDGDGYLLNMSDWSPDVMMEMAQTDGIALNEEMIEYIMKAREWYDEFQSVPPIREFAKSLGMDRKAQPLYDLFKSAPMKVITKYGGMPKPTGCT